MNTFRSILVDVDATATVQPALDIAADIARRSGASLCVVDGIPSDDSRRVQIDPGDETWARRSERLARLTSRVRGVHIECDVLPGPPAQALIDDVERHGHDLVMRAHARDIVMRGAPFADVGVHLFRRCPCPVWAVGPGARAQRPRILAAVDVQADDALKNDLSRSVFEVARALSALQDGSLTALHAWQPFGESRVAGYGTDTEYRSYLDRTRRRAAQDLERFVGSAASDLAVRLESRKGSLEDVLPAFVVAEGVDVVVMGTMGRTGIFRKLRGNTLEQLIDRLPCSLVGVRPCTRTT